MAEMVEAVLNDEFKIVLPKHRADRPEWYTPEGWEKKRLISMHMHLGKGDVIYYIGAEEGEMPALCQMWGAEVVLFEPNPKVWPNIKAIWDANKLKRPMGLVCGFASNKTQMIPVNSKAETFWSIDTETDWPECATDEVIGNHGFKELYLEADNYPQWRIDDCYGDESRMKPPTAITLDVEGSEWRVLEGAEETIKKYHPKIWLSGHPEFMQHQFGEHLGDLRRWLKNFGYTETLLDYQHEAHLFYEVKK